MSFFINLKACTKNLLYRSKSWFLPEEFYKIYRRENTHNFGPCIIAFAVAIISTQLQWQQQHRRQEREPEREEDRAQSKHAFLLPSDSLPAFTEGRDKVSTNGNLLVHLGNQHFAWEWEVSYFFWALMKMPRILTERVCYRYVLPCSQSKPLPFLNSFLFSIISHVQLELTKIESIKGPIAPWDISWKNTSALCHTAHGKQHGLTYMRTKFTENIAFTRALK